MVQWVKNPTAVARVAVEIWVRSPAWYSGLKDLVLPQWLKLGFSPWPRNFHMLRVQPLKKKNSNPRENEVKENEKRSLEQKVKSREHWVKGRFGPERMK